MIPAFWEPGSKSIPKSNAIYKSEQDWHIAHQSHFPLQTKKTYQRINPYKSHIPSGYLTVQFAMENHHAIHR